MNKQYASELAKRLTSDGYTVTAELTNAYDGNYELYIEGLTEGEEIIAFCEKYSLHAIDGYYTGGDHYNMRGTVVECKEVIDANTGEVLSLDAAYRRVCRGWTMYANEGKHYIHNNKSEAGQGVLAFLIVLAVFSAAFIFISGGL